MIINKNTTNFQNYLKLFRINQQLIKLFKNIKYIIFNTINLGLLSYLTYKSLEFQRMQDSVDITFQRPQTAHEEQALTISQQESIYTEKPKNEENDPPKQNLSNISKILITLLIVTVIILLARIVLPLIIPKTEESQRTNQKGTYIVQERQPINPFKMLDQRQKKREQSLKVKSDQEKAQKNIVEKQKLIPLSEKRQSKPNLKNENNLGFNILVSKFINRNVKNPKRSIKGEEEFEQTKITFNQMAKAQVYRSLIDNPSNTDLANEEYQYYEKKYGISKYEEKPFCIVVNGFDSIEGGRYKRNIQSILQQNYNNYHVIYYENGFKNSQGQTIKDYLQKNIKNNKIEVITNPNRDDYLTNLRNAAKNHCNSYEIMFRVNGQDELIGKQVLKLFNAIYQQKKSWSVFSSSIDSENQFGESRPLKEKRNSYRQHPSISSNQVSFYTILFQNIKDKDLMNEKRQFLKGASDSIFLAPIYEMANKKVTYVPQVTYYQQKGTQDYERKARKEAEKQNEKYVKKNHKYDSLSNII